MNPFLNDPRRIVLAFVYAVFAILACLYLTSCSAIKYRAGVTYHGATLSYDGKAIVLALTAIGSKTTFADMPSEEIRLAILSPEHARDALARIAEKEIGTREIGGNNRGPRVREYQSATWTEPGVWPWCMAFVAWCIREWLKSPSVQAIVHFHRPKTTGAFDFIRWAKDEGLQVLGENEPCRRGDIVVFDFSHIGIVAEDSERGEITAIEGNTNGKGERDSESGDGVWRKYRARSLVKAFIRLV